MMDALWSLGKKLLLLWDSREDYYEINPFLQEVCYTHLRNEKEMRIIEGIPFFNSVQKPVYNEIRQAHEQGDYPTFWKLIKAMLAKGLQKETLAILHELKHTDPKPEAIMNEISIIYQAQKNYDAAIDILTKALRLDERNEKNWNELGIVYRKMGEYEKAIESLEKAIEIKPTNWPSYTELAFVYRRQGLVDDAIAILKKAVKGGNFPSFNELAVVYRSKGMFDEAIDILKKAVEGGNIPSFNELAHLYIEQGKITEAKTIIEEGLNEWPNEPGLTSLLKRIEKEKNTKQNKSPMPKNERNPSTPKHQKVLFIAANPSNASRIQTDTEYRIIKAELKRGSHRDFFELRNPEIAVTITELIRAMSEKPDMIHFSGHGNDEGICIATDANKTILLPLLAMERLFKPLQEVTKVIILNSCYSAEQAQSISNFGMYVVGHNLPIGDAAAISFSKGLYTGLSEGKEFIAAFNDAMIVVLTESKNYADVIEVWKDGERLYL